MIRTLRAIAFERFALVALLAAASLLVAFDALAQGPSPEQIKAWLSTPLALAVLMLLGSFGSLLEDMVEARRAGVVYEFSLPETLLMLGGNSAGFLVMLMADQLNFAAVIFGGYTFSTVAGWARETPPVRQ